MYLTKPTIFHCLLLNSLEPAGYQNNLQNQSNPHKTSQLLRSGGGYSCISQSTALTYPMTVIKITTQWSVLENYSGKLPFNNFLSTNQQKKILRGRRGGNYNHHRLDQRHWGQRQREVKTDSAFCNVLQPCEAGKKILPNIIFNNYVYKITHK